MEIELQISFPKTQSVIDSEVQWLLSNARKYTERRMHTGLKTKCEHFQVLPSTPKLIMK